MEKIFLACLKKKKNKKKRVYYGTSYILKTFVVF